MTAKEKATELIDRFYSLDFIKHELDGGGGFIDVKQCALICVSEIIPTTFSKSKSWDKWKIIPLEEATTEYWEKVKSEIKNYDNTLP